MTIAPPPRPSKQCRGSSSNNTRCDPPRSVSVAFNTPVVTASITRLHDALLAPASTACRDDEALLFMQVALVDAASSSAAAVEHTDACFNSLPLELADRIFTLLQPSDLKYARLVSRSATLQHCYKPHCCETLLASHPADIDFCTCACVAERWQTAALLEA